jgi:hypothetical protein
MSITKVISIRPRDSSPEVVDIAGTYTASLKIAKAPPVHETPHNIHSHESPPVQHVDLPLGGRNIVHFMNREARHLLDGVVPVLKQSFPAHRSREHAAACRVFLVIGKSEQRPLWSRTGQFVVPIALHEVCADTMDLLEAFEVADCELIWGYTDVRPIPFMKRVDIVRAAACHDSNGKRQPSEARMPRSRHGSQRTGERAEK